MVIRRRCQLCELRVFWVWVEEVRLERAKYQYKHVMLSRRTSRRLHCCSTAMYHRWYMAVYENKVKSRKVSNFQARQNYRLTMRYHEKLRTFSEVACSRRFAVNNILARVHTLDCCRMFTKWRRNASMLAMRRSGTLDLFERMARRSLSTYYSFWRLFTIERVAARSC